MKTCAQCNQEFQIFDEDREFYQKINVPEPTWCPECRNMRRCAYRNERVLYMRSCDLCKKLYKTENSSFCNEVESIKDSYMAICSFFGERYRYTYWLGWCKDVVDSSFVLHSELCYGCQDLRKGYNCRYVFNSQNMVDSDFCFGCSDCTNCFMCVNLRHKSYCISNEQYTKEAHEKDG